MAKLLDLLRRNPNKPRMSGKGDYVADGDNVRVGIRAKFIPADYSPETLKALAKTQGVTVRGDNPPDYPFAQFSETPVGNDATEFLDNFRRVDE